MTDETKSAHSNNHGNYERRDIGIAAVLYFLLALAVSGVLVHFIAAGVFSFLDKRNEERQAPVSPLVNNAPVDTRHLPPQYQTDRQSTDYEKYLQEKFPQPQLETDERTQLNQVRLREEETLHSYGYIDEKAGTIHIPIDRAMDLIVQRGLPVRTQAEAAESSSAKSEKAEKKAKK